MADPFSTQEGKNEQNNPVLDEPSKDVKELDSMSFPELCGYLKTRTKSEISQVLLDRLADDMKQFKEKSPEALQEAIFSAFEEKLLAKVNGISKEKSGPAKP